MKKRIMSTIMSIFMVPFVLSPYTIKSYADNEISNTSTIIEYFPDDSYIVITLIQDSNLVLSNTTSGSKTASFYNSDNELQCAVFLFQRTFPHNRQGRLWGAFPFV